MENKEFIVPQDLNFDIYTKVFTGKQLSILAGFSLVVGIIPSMFVQNYVVKLILVGFGLSVGYVLAKMEVDGMILFDYLQLYVSYSRERKVYIMGEFLPIEDIRDGLIYLKNGTVSAVYEITGISYDMMSEATKSAAAQNIIEMLYSINKSASFYAWRKKYDISRDLREIKAIENKNREYFRSYRKMLIDTVSDKQIGTMRYFVIFNGNEREVSEQGGLLMEVAAKNTLIKVRRIYDIVGMLYAVMNLHRAYIQKLEGEDE